MSFFSATDFVRGFFLGGGQGRPSGFPKGALEKDDVRVVSRRSGRKALKDVDNVVIRGLSPALDFSCLAGNPVKGANGWATSGLGLG